MAMPTIFYNAPKWVKYAKEKKYMKIIVPDIGDFKDVAVIEVLVQVGDVVAVEDSLITIESDKATTDIPAPAAGKISAVHVHVGDKVSMGSHIADLDETDSSVAATTAAAAPEATPPPPPTPSSQPTAAEVRVPDIGDFKDIAIIEVLIKPGDTVAAEDSLITLESDKATMEVPAPFAGQVSEVFVQAGNKVSMGDLIATIAAGESAPPPSPPAPDTAPVPAAPKETPDTAPPPPTARPAPSPPVVQKDTSDKPHASPSVRHYARELGVNIRHVKGSGPRGRILKSDVQSFVKDSLNNSGSALPTVPRVDFAKFGGIELHPMPRIRQLSASYLHRNWVAAPHVTQFAEADITDMEEFRRSLSEEAKKSGYRMTPLAFLIRAAVMALKQYPRFNSSLLEEEKCLVQKNYYHIGVAVDTKDGLLVPVLRDAEQKGLTDIARELGELSARARDGKLKAEDMQGGCFTISSLGGIGGSFFTPILNLPEAAILGVSRAQMCPQWHEEQKEFVPRLMLPLSLSYDHRIIDGAEGARFIVYYANLLSDIRRLAL